jgi:hypothetical protein
VSDSTFKPIVPPVEFRPMRGLLSVGEQLAARFGLGHIWGGEQGLGEVARRKLEDMGVPSEPVPLTGDAGMTPVQLAEHSGFIKKRRVKKVKAK